VEATTGSAGATSNSDDGQAGRAESMAGSESLATMSPGFVTDRHAER
jgi:hypothetical protein